MLGSLAQSYLCRKDDYIQSEYNLHKLRTIIAKVKFCVVCSGISSAKYAIKSFTKAADRKSPVTNDTAK
jgi:hypothetical protein